MSVPRFRLEFTRRARRDVRAILRHTTKQWGSHQSNVYRTTLENATESLREFPFRGTSRNDIAPDLLAVIVREHVIFYVVVDDRVTIVRVLHHAMDADAAFESGIEL